MPGYMKRKDIGKIRIFLCLIACFVTCYKGDYAHIEANRVLLKKRAPVRNDRYMFRVFKCIIYIP